VSCTIASRPRAPSEVELRAKARAKAEAQMKRRSETVALLETFELVILEEAHEASGNSYFDIMRLCKNAHYRLALTATPFMKDSEEANMRLMACSGPVAIHVTEELLISRGILAKPYFVFARIEDPAPEGEIEFKDARGTGMGFRRTKLFPSTPGPSATRSQWPAA
jgi:superfamily II DNA or RNA helicase